MKVMRIITAGLAIAIMMGSTSGCGNWFSASQEDKDTVLQEIGRRGFVDPVLAPDGSDRTVYVYAGYGGCRLRFEVISGRIGYPNVGDDVSPAMLDGIESFKPCRDNASGAQPTPQ